MKKQFLTLALALCSFILVGQQTYYDNVNLSLTGLALKSALANKITTTHTHLLSYDDVWGASMVTDLNPTNSSNVLLIYGWENGSDGDITNDRERDKDNNGGSVGQWNREHVYPRSLGDPNLGTSGPGSDAHSLRPADPQRNSSRSNRRFASGSGNSGGSNGNWYPGDEWKGDVARMMMYMYLRYDTRCLPSNVGVGNNSNTPDDMIDLFLQWNADDPVSELERQRNTYHENTNNTYAQGNRNPFIDNPYLATRIWGGPEAEDSWGIYTGADTQAPTVPTNVTLSNITTSSITVSWTASTDNVGVSSYEIYMNGNLTQEVSSTNFTATGLTPNTNYSFQILAKDIAENESALSSPENGSTLEDTEAPSVPTNVTISNETSTSFKITWTASTDNTSVTDYDVFLDGNLNNSTSNTTLTISGLTPSTTYAVTIVANDSSNNQSAPSSPVNGTTNGSGSGGVAPDLFFSEYVEGSSNNKALEIVNLTGNSVDLSNYSIRRQRNGGQDGDDWGHNYVLSGTLVDRNVFVIIHNQADLQQLINEADLVVTPNFSSDINTFIAFNGNDPVGLFKNGVLIDIIGTYNGGSGDFAENVTLRRKFDVTQPNSTFDKVNEWDEFASNTVDNIGQHSSTLSNDQFTIQSVTLYPNPVRDLLYVEGVQERAEITIYSVIGSRVMTGVIDTHNNHLRISDLKTGVYLIRMVSQGKSITKKFIKSN